MATLRRGHAALAGTRGAGEGQHTHAEAWACHTGRLITLAMPVPEVGMMSRT